MCCFSSRCSIISAGVWCLVQSVVWAVLAFVGIAAYTCDLQVKPDIKDPTYYLYFVYLFNGDCATLPPDLDFEKILGKFFTTPSGLTTPAGSTTPFPLPEWPTKFAQADYVHDVLQAYAALNVTWAVICLITVVAVVMNVRRWFAYVPWILVTAANIVLDVVVTIKFASDAVVAMTPQGLIEEIIGVDLHLVDDPYKADLYKQDVFKSMEGLTAIPSIVMLLLSSRAVVFWLLNVLCLICVSVSISRFSKEKGKEKALTTYPYDRSGRPGVHNKNPYIEELRSNGPDQPHEYAYAPGYSTPYSYTGGDFKMPSLHPAHPLTNNDLASSSAPGTNLHSPTAQPYYMELQDPKPRYHAPSAPTDNYERQPLHRLPVHNDLQGNNGPDVRRRAPHNHGTDSEISSQPPIKNRPASNIVFPRVDLRSSPPEADPEYLEPRQGIYNTMPSADNYEQPPLPKLPVPGGVTGNNGSAEQLKAPHVHRRDSDRPAYRPQPSTTNLNRRSMDYEDVKPLERKTSQTPQDRTEDTNRNTGRRLSGSVPRPSGSLPPDELRSQLPWSYFGPRDVPMRPKPKQDPVVEEELMPPVPVPDYTLHFGKAARPVNSQWSEDGASSSGHHAADHRGTSASGVDRNNSLLERNRL